MKFLSPYKRLTLVIEPAVFGESKGKRIVFEDGMYETEKEDEIKFLKTFDGYGKYVFGVDITGLKEKKK